jgi:hypothetical protein
VWSSQHLSWSMEARSSSGGGCGNASVGGGTHEYSDWEAANGGQGKVIKPSLKWGIKSKKDEEVWGCYCET